MQARAVSAVGNCQKDLSGRGPCREAFWAWSDLVRCQGQVRCRYRVRSTGHLVRCQGQVRQKTFGLSTA